MPAKKTVRIGVAILALGMACTPMRPAQSGVLSRLRHSISSLWSRRSESRQEARSARYRAAALDDRAEAVHDQLEDTQRELLQANDIYLGYWRQMKHTEGQIVVTRRRLEVVTARYKSHRSMFARRLAAMQKNGKLGYLELFLGTHTLSDLTRRVHLYNAMARRDAEIQSALKGDRYELLATRAMLDEQWGERNRLQLAANHERVRIAGVESAQARLLDRINTSRVASLAYAAEQERSSHELSDMINDLESRRDAIARAYDTQASSQPHHGGQRIAMRGGGLRPMPITSMVYRDDLQPESGGGELREGFSQEGGQEGGGWGLPVRGRLSSRYGMRFHPILRRYKLHTGDDLAAGYGAPIRAAHEGRVLWAGWKKAYGNTIIVDLGNGVTTLYGHASKLNVRQGQPIKRGDYIGNVGSTGWSTGPHLHFEVRKNGQPIDPTPYLRGH